MPARVSVVIPTLNEAGAIAACVRAAAAQRPHEIIIADAGSADGTAAAAASAAPVRLAPAARGRAAQMNAGAREAAGDALLFLHADTTLPDGALELVSAALSLPGVVGGRFRVRFDDPGLRYRAIAWYTRFSPFSYGDQAFFVRADVFGEMGGYDESAPFEDVDFYARLRARGRTVILRESVVTSARRFRKTGFFRQKAVNAALSVLVGAGLKPRRLIRKWYPDIR